MAKKKDTSRGEVELEGGGTGNTAGAAPDQGAQPQAPKEAAPKKGKGDKALQEAFLLNPVEQLFRTSDGQFFADVRHANHHARSLQEQDVEQLDRKDWA